MSDHDDFPYEAVAPCRYCGTLLDGQGHNELGRYHDVYSCREYAVTSLRARVAELERDRSELLAVGEALQDEVIKSAMNAQVLEVRCAELERIINGNCEGLLSEHEALEDTFRKVRDQRDELTDRCARLEAALRDVRQECEEERGHAPEAGLATVYQIVTAALQTDEAKR